MTSHTIVLITLITAPLTAQEIVLVPGFTGEFRGVSSHGDEIWASGRNGTFARSADGGASWRAGTIPGAEDLFLVDVEVLGRDSACVLATSFDGGLGRTYRTTDGGRSWTMTFEIRRAQAFLDAMAFWDDRHGVAFGDPMGGVFFVMWTDDGCGSWIEVPDSALPTPLPGEAGFAASGTAVAVAGTDHAWIGTGGGSVARVLRSDDRGRTWTAVPTAMVGGTATGIFGVAFRDTLVGVAVGGNYQEPEAVVPSVLVTADGGRSWTLSGSSVPSGVRYGAAFLPGSDTFVAAGPSGLGYSRDLGRTWTVVDTLYAFGLHAHAGRVWASGPAGWIARVDLRPLLQPGQ